MESFDKIAYTSKILKNNPNEKMLFSILTLITTLFLNNNYISAIVLLLMYFFIVYIGGIKNKIFFKLFALPLIFLFISIISIMITKVSPLKEYIFTFSIASYEYGISKNAILDGLRIVLKTLSCVSCLYFLILTTPVTDILYTLEKIKLPKIFIELVGLVYRYIFVIIEVSQLIYISQHSRLGYSNIKRSFNSMGKLISSLFLKALKQADESFVSLEARCYNGEIKFINQNYISSKKNIILIIILNLTFVLFNLFYIS